MAARRQKQLVTTIYAVTMMMLLFFVAVVVAGNCAPDIINTSDFFYSIEGLGLTAFAKYSNTGQIYKDEFVKVKLARVMEVSNVKLVPPSQENFDNPVLVQEALLTDASTSCTVRDTSTVTTLGGNPSPVLQTCVNEDIIYANGAKMTMSLCVFNDSGVITFAGVPINITENETKYSVRITDWPWVNRTTNVMLIVLETTILSYGLDNFNFGWLGNPSNVTDRLYGLSYDTLPGLHFDSKLQFWASADYNLTEIYLKSKWQDGDIDQTNNANGTQTNTFRVTMGFLPFDVLEWDPSFAILFDGADPTVPSAPTAPTDDQLAPQMNTVVVGASVGVVAFLVIAVIVAGSLFLAHRRRIQSKAIHSRMRPQLAQDASIIANPSPDSSPSWHVARPSPSI